MPLQPAFAWSLLLTAGEWLAFMDDGGYERPELWLAEGWATAAAEGWAAPLYWAERTAGWHEFTLAGERPVDPDRFQKWMGALLQLRGQDILRSKGILAIDGAPRRYVYQGVHMMMDADWGTPWKDGEKRSSKLVFIGRNLDGENLKRGFEECLK